jgi:hypothetical protein
MQTIEYRTIDKSDWPRGPWDCEPDKRQWVDEKTGLPCLIVRAGHELGHLCGYVGVPRGHPFYEADYDSLPVEVHGGLTFASRCSHGAEDRSICHKVEPGEPDDVWWLGFDCAHLGDISPGMERFRLRGYGGDTYKNIDYVTREVQNLARQLASIASASPGGTKDAG